MKDEHKKELFVCRRLRHMGFVHGAKIKLYGDEFDLESNPCQQGNRYVIEAISHRSGASRKIAIPVLITGLIEREFDVTGNIAA